jgi:TonB-dependent receptor
MIDLPFNETMNLVTGVRYETTNMTTTVLPDPFALWLPPGGGNPGFIIDYPSSEYDAKINQANILPMVGVNWNIRDDLVLRTAFAQTLARPNFFELVPVLQYEFVGGPLFIGNPALQMSSLNNYDMRLDWTPEEEWLISGSVFYKQIYNPIQYVQRFAASFSYTTPVNFSSATLFGVELEGRVTAEPLFGEDFKGLATGANFTYMNSQVQLPEIDQAAFRAYGVDVPSLPMTATPDYLFNVNLTYDYDATGTQVGIFYNYQGKSLVAGASTDSGGGPPPVPGDLVPSIYQLPYGTLNFTLQQRLIYGFACSFAAKNLTNPIRETQFESFDGQTAINSSYTAGIDLSFGLSWQLIF